MEALEGRERVGGAGMADLVIAVAYFVIPLELGMYIMKRRCVGRMAALDGF